MKRSLKNVLSPLNILSPLTVIILVSLILILAACSSGINEETTNTLHEATDINTIDYSAGLTINYGAGIPRLATQNTELLANSGFNTNSDWFNCGNAANYTIVNGALQLSGTSACVYQTVVATPNTTYNLACDSASSATFSNVTLSMLNSNYGTIVNDSAPANTGATQPSIQLSLDSPANTSFVAVTMYSEGPATHESCSLTTGSGGTTPTTPPTGSGTGLYGRYVNNGTSFQSPDFERVDSTIDFNWGQGSPASAINANNFAIIWTGKIQPRYSESYTFYTTSDDGVRLTVNGERIIDNWTNHSATTDTGTITLQANQLYDIVLEYYEATGGTAMTLEWSSNQQAREVVPANQLYPAQSIASTDGQWSAVQDWPLIATHLANLPDGRVMAWSAYDEGRFGGVAGDREYTQAVIFNPNTGGFQEADNPTHDMFCAGLATQSDGTIFAAGGGGGNVNRIQASTFSGNSWSSVGPMPNAHWYGTAVVDANDDVLISLGDSANGTTDIYSNGSWRNLPGVNLAGVNESGLETPDWYPQMHLTPRGTIFHSGGTTQMHEINTSGNATTTSRGNRNQDGVTGEVYRQWATAVMIDEGQIMLTGGTPQQSNPGSLNSSVLIDVNATNPVVSRIAPMQYARSFHDTLILPTGEILVVGGNSTGVEFNDNGSQLIPEIYNPDTNTWRSVAALGEPRNYHSATTLLQDGRVLAAGGGLCGCAADHQNGEIFSPPYLFNNNGSLAARPVISSAPNNIGYNQTFTVNMTGSGSNNIVRFSMIRFSATTHSMNSDLRQDVLSFTNQGGGSYQLTSDSNRNVVVPGYYYLFATNSNGVPSVASIIQIN